MMKTKNLFLIFGSVFVIVIVIAIAFRGKSATQQQEEAAPSGADTFRVDNTTYDRLAKAARSGDCDAAFRLARHHAFATGKYDEAIQWYRIAARCPDLAAKGELLSMLRFDQEHDSEVDRLLLEIERLDPKAAESDREAVRSARAYRKRSPSK